MAKRKPEVHFTLGEKLALAFAAGAGVGAALTSAQGAEFVSACVKAVLQPYAKESKSNDETGTGKSG